MGPNTASKVNPTHLASREPAVKHSLLTTQYSLKVLGVVCGAAVNGSLSAGLRDAGNTEMLPSTNWCGGQC